MKFIVNKTNMTVTIGTDVYRLIKSGRESAGHWFEFADQPYASIAKGFDSPPVVIIEPQETDDA